MKPLAVVPFGALADRTSCFSPLYLNLYQITRARAPFELNEVCIHLLATFEPVS